MPNRCCKSYVQNSCVFWFPVITEFCLELFFFFKALLIRFIFAGASEVLIRDWLQFYCGSKKHLNSSSEQFSNLQFYVRKNFPWKAFKILFHHEIILERIKKKNVNTDLTYLTLARRLERQLLKGFLDSKHVV